MKNLQISVCTECGHISAANLQKALAKTELPKSVTINESPCLGPCDRPTALAVQTQGHAGYVFAGITLDDAQDIAATCTLILDSDQGWIEDARPCGRLRHLLVARMPS